MRHGHAHGGGINSLVRFDRLEGWDADPGTGQAWEAKAWVGGDVQRLWLRSEGEHEDGRTLAADLEVFYGRGISPWWDLLAGVRHDFAPGDSRTWAALGVQGMAPYKFEVAATAYLGSGGRTALRAEVEYELPLTRRLLLQPKLELELHGRDDVRRGIGTGLSTAEAGVRLRWAATPRFAPYFGVVHERSFGDTRRYRAAEHGQARDTHWVAGLRWWF
ncbi:copper resistance protein B [Pseudoxanthomonas suwonensis]